LNVDITAPISGVIQRVNAAPAQATTGGAPLVEITNQSTVWIRVPVYVGELNESARRAAAASTADLYYSLANNDGALRPGQRVDVTLSLRGAEESLIAPWAAVLHDVHGGAWVYEATAPQTFVRRPVEVRYVADSLAVLARGPAPGTKVVTAGAAELFGTEFGAGK
jgi:multidrug efflux pump subunit AcrA (membrane-fusion protein)